MAHPSRVRVPLHGLVLDSIPGTGWRPYAAARSREAAEDTCARIRLTMVASTGIVRRPLPEQCTRSHVERPLPWDGSTALSRSASERPRIRVGGEHWERRERTLHDDLVYLSGWFSH